MSMYGLILWERYKNIETNETINDHSHWETLFLNQYLESTINTLR